MSDLMAAKRIVVKVGTSTLTYDTGKLNIRRVENLVGVLSDLCNSGLQVALVTSGAIGVGVGKLGLSGKPSDTPGRQAAATVGQCELMYIYDKYFGEFGYPTGQLLITKDDLDDLRRRGNLVNAFERLFEYGAVPIVNENDAVAVEEIVFGDNDTLSAAVAKLIGAQLLVILTDIDGLYDSDPRTDPEASLIPVVHKIDDKVMALAGGSGTSRGTGGMLTKLHAAQLATAAGIPTVVMNGQEPHDIYRLLEGHRFGTLFTPGNKG